MSPSPGAVRVVIAGGGFGGLAVARELERLQRADMPLDITLINRENYFLFTPMLHEVAASDLELTTIVNPLRRLVRNVRLFTGVVDRIDTDAREVHVSHADGAHAHALPYDHLVLALGTVTNFFGIAGLRERAVTMKTLGDAITLRNQLIANLEEADFECSRDIREPLLTVLVAGGGFAGVETVAAVNDFMRSALGLYRNLKASDVRVVVVHPGAYLLPELGEVLGRYTQERLTAHGVEVVLHARVTGVSDDMVHLSNGQTIRSRNLVWTAGTSANPVLDSVVCAKDRGRLVVDATMRVAGCDGLWALGDCAAIPNADGGTYPPTAQHALREGKQLAQNILATEQGGALMPFRFRTLGLLAAIGQRTGVADIFGLKFSGFIAWWLWRTVYLAKLPRFEKKVRVALEWTLDLFFSKDTVQFATRQASFISRAETPGTSAADAPPAANPASGNHFAPGGTLAGDAQARASSPLRMENR
jgi:NADH:ubiquinone reductase (H+-translocating)